MNTLAVKAKCSDKSAWKTCNINLLLLLKTTLSPVWGFEEVMDDLAFHTVAPRRTARARLF